MTQPMDTLTLTDFQRRSTELIGALAASGRPLVLTVEGASKVVVMAIDAFERMAELAERAEAAAKIRQGLKDVKAGRTTPATEVFEEQRRKLIAGLDSGDPLELVGVEVLDGLSHPGWASCGVFFYKTMEEHAT